MRRILGTRRSSAPLASAILVLMTHAIWGLVPRPASGQSVAPGATPASHTGGHKASFLDSASETVPAERSGAASSQAGRHACLPGRQDGMAAQSVPTAVALPVENGAASTAKPEGSPATPPPPPRLPVDTALIPGRAVEPIDLANALRLAGARDLDIAIARQRILQAAADLKQARVLWLPSLFYGPTWYRADGQIQTITGQVETIDRSSLFLVADGGAGQLLPRPIAGDWFSLVERSEHDSADLRCDLRAHGGATRPGRQPGRAPDRDQRRVATNRRSLLRSPGRQRAAGHRPRGRRQRRGSFGDHRSLRPPGTGPGGRPSPSNDRAQAPGQGYPPCQRAVARRLSQPGPPPGAQPCYGVRPGRAAGVQRST